MIGLLLNFAGTELPPNRRTRVELLPKRSAADAPGSIGLMAFSAASMRTWQGGTRDEHRWARDTNIPGGARHVRTRISPVPQDSGADTDHIRRRDDRHAETLWATDSRASSVVVDAKCHRCDCARSRQSVRQHRIAIDESRHPRSSLPVEVRRRVGARRHATGWSSSPPGGISIGTQATPANSAHHHRTTPHLGTTLWITVENRWIDGGQLRTTRSCPRWRPVVHGSIPGAIHRP